MASLAPSTPTGGSPSRSPSLPSVVRRLGWVSFFTDAASDMIYPLLPAFLVSLGAGPEALGWVEGIAEATSAGVKAVAGRLSDRAVAKKPFVVVGYSIATLVRPVLALVAAPWQVVLVRSTDRLGKGIRSAPRDAIVASAVPQASRGLAYGFHRMMDNLGAVLGPLLAFGLARGLGLGLRTIFACALLPGLVALATLVFGVEEPAVRGQLETRRDGSRRGTETGAVKPEGDRALPRAVRSYRPTPSCSFVCSTWASRSATHRWSG
jgi:MFS family permease